MKKVKEEEIPLIVVLFGVVLLIISITLTVLGTKRDERLGLTPCEYNYVMIGKVLTPMHKSNCNSNRHLK